MIPQKNTNQTTQELENKQLTILASQTLPPRGIQLQPSGTIMEEFRKNLGAGQVLFLDNSHSCPGYTQKSDMQIMATLVEDNIIPPLKTLSPHIYEWLVRDE